MNKKVYNKPIIRKIALDNTISLQMASQPGNPDPRTTGGSKKGSDEPFQSPFGDKPFS
jgi:hypothetical protein